MTVEQLINQLQSYPKDKTVLVMGDKITDIREVYDYPLGDYANPKCDYADVVWIE